MTPRCPHPAPAVPGDSPSLAWREGSQRQARLWLRRGGLPQVGHITGGRVGWCGIVGSNVTMWVSVWCLHGVYMAYTCSMQYWSPRSSLCDLAVGVTAGVLGICSVVAGLAYRWGRGEEE